MNRLGKGALRTHRRLWQLPTDFVLPRKILPSNGQKPSPKNAKADPLRDPLLTGLDWCWLADGAGVHAAGIDRLDRVRRLRCIGGTAVDHGLGAIDTLSINALRSINDLS